MLNTTDKVKFPFGKHKGQYIEDVYKNHHDYIQWLKDKGVDGFVYDEIKRLDNFKEQERLNKLEVIRSNINELVLNKEKVYAQNIHCVGFGYIIGGIHLEEVMSNYTVYSIQDDINIKLTKDEYTTLYKILDKQWHSQSKELWQDRGLY